MKPSDKKLIIACAVICFISAAVMLAFNVCSNFTAIEFFKIRDDYSDDYRAFKVIFLTLGLPITVAVFGMLIFVSLYMCAAHIYSGIRLIAYTKSPDRRVMKKVMRITLTSDGMVLFGFFTSIAGYVSICQHVPEFFTASNIGLIVLAPIITALALVSAILCGIVILRTRNYGAYDFRSFPVKPEDPFTQL